MIPDKIYCWSGIMGSLYASSQKPAVKTEEYIRKDALLEKINKTAEIVNGIADDDYKRGCQIIIDKVTDIINSM